MLEILETPKHLVAFKLSKELTADDVDRATKALTDALKDQERVNIFTEVEGSISLTFEGLWKDLVNGLNNFGIRRKINRLGIVTGNELYSFLFRVEGFVFSSIEMRVFSPEQRDEAFSWTSFVPEPLPKPVTPPKAVHFLQTTNPGVFAYEINGRVTEEDIRDTVKELKSFFEGDGKGNVLARIKNFDGFDFYGLFNDDLYRIKYQALSHVDKYAVVGPPSWMRNALELIGPIFDMKLRVFDTDQEADAWEWVGASQAMLAESS
ncbi:MAG: STAS/SEC14 domain-containing protein [Acidobacteriota bacterium]